MQKIKQIKRRLLEAKIHLRDIKNACENNKN